MKKLSIKMRITLWYTLLMTLVVVVAVALLLSISRFAVESDAQQQLERVVEQNAEQLEYDDGQFDIDSDFAYYEAGVYSLVYDEEQRLLAGQLPAGFTAEVALQQGGVHTAQAGGTQYYVYDKRVAQDGGPALWVRGIVPAQEGSGTVDMITRIAFVLLPFIVVLGALGGYGIARWSLRPIGQLADAANAISEGRDLSRRIDLGQGQDEIHQLAQTFDGMIARLERSFEAEKQFTADASHELKTPVAVILAQCEYALQHAGNETEYRETLAVVQRQAERMSYIVAQLLAFTRLEQGVEQAALEPTDLGELAGILCEEYVPVDRRGITLHTELAAGVVVQADRALMARLLENLLNNAYKYGKPGGNIWLQVYESQQQACLAVADDGIGIPQAELGNIWQRFYQVDTARSPERSGSMGLGLAMVRQIARLHFGEAQVQSVPGQGSTFTIVLPKSQ